MSCAWDKAGEIVMAAAAQRAARVPGALAPINLYKNNTDNKGASYGTHENYLMTSAARRSLRSCKHLTPFFVSRQVIAVVRGASDMGQQTCRTSGFQLSQRADFFEVEVGLETTLKRPIINTRDEPHADADKYRRLHVIIGDANLAEVAATCSRSGPRRSSCRWSRRDSLAGIDLDCRTTRPRAARGVARPGRCGTSVELRDGRTLTAVQICSVSTATRRTSLSRTGSAVTSTEGTADDARSLGRRCSTISWTTSSRLAGQLDWIAKRQIA
jgi:Pup amidohydrolase